MFFKVKVMERGDRIFLIFWALIVGVTLMLILLKQLGLINTLN